MKQRQRALVNALPLYIQQMEEARALYELTKAEHYLIRAEELAKYISYLEMRVGA